MKPGRKIRVLVIGPAEPLIGGQAIQVRKILDGFGNDHNVRAEFLAINPEFLKPLQQIKYLRTVLTSFRYFLGLIANVPRSDLVHLFAASFSSFALSVVPAIVVSKLFRKPVLLNYRSGFAEEHLTTWPRTSLPFIRRCDAVITPSEYLVDVFGKFGITARSIVNSVDASRFRFRSRENLRPRFLSNRNFEDLYNVACTIRAFSLIAKEYPDAKLVVAGGGPLEEELRELVLELELENVRFVGRVESEKMARLYDEADIYLNSPNVDNMPNSLLEAFASGTPVVTTNAGGIPYIVEHELTGLIVDVDDHEGLAAEAIRLLKDDHLATRLSSGAREEVEKYDWTTVKHQWKEVYASLARRTDLLPPKGGSGRITI